MSFCNASRYLVGATFATLIACASQPEVQAPRVPAPGTETVAVTSVGPESVGGYRRVEKDGVEYYCRAPVVTGSRMQRAETCVTKEQLEEMAEQSQGLVRSMQGPVFSDGASKASPAGGLN
jgi:hypothetical protein